MMPYLEIADPSQLQLIQDDSTRINLHPLWLRERCRNAVSMDQRTGQRFYNPSDLDAGLKITRLHRPAAGQRRNPGRGEGLGRAQLHLGRDALAFGDGRQPVDLAQMDAVAGQRLLGSDDHLGAPGDIACGLRGDGARATKRRILLLTAQVAAQPIRQRGRAARDQRAHVAHALAALFPEKAAIPLHKMDK